MTVLKRLLVGPLIAMAAFMGWAQATEGHDHDSLHAHEHGRVVFQLAADKKQLLVELQGPMESFVGFEQAPQTAEQKKAWQASEQLWAQAQGTIFQLGEVSCQEQESQFQRDQHGKGHAEVKASKLWLCPVDLKGKKLRVRWPQAWKRMKTIVLRAVLSGNKAKTNTYEHGEKITLEL